MRCCCRALEDLDIAAEHDPSSVYTTFVKIKVLLTQGEASKALDELQPLMACEDFSLDFLRVNDHPHKSYGLTARVNETLDRQEAKILSIWWSHTPDSGPKRQPNCASYETFMHTWLGKVSTLAVTSTAVTLPHCAF